MSTTDAATTAAPTAAPPVESRLAQLRRQAEEDPGAARDWTWAWLHELGARGAASELNELFRAGTAPGTALDGPTQGMLVTTTISGAADRGARSITSAWMPWLGKAFRRSEELGHNRLLESARWPSKLLWPRYEMWPGDGERNAFEFRTRIEAGADDPDREVLVLDYAAVAENPAMIRKIRDELTEIVPGAYLGKVLWRRGSGAYALIGFFALRLPV
jgi:hypothetical protein